MARIRAVEIRNFRVIKDLIWFPSPGLNCLIGPGDAGKSTILDAIDFCLGARRNIQFTDADFHRLNVDEPIQISITIGELNVGLQNFDAYGLYLRSFDPLLEKIGDEPEHGLETALTLRLTVASDLEPAWSLVSNRAEAQAQSRNLSWSDRIQLAPTRIGVTADYHLGWRRGSVLNRLSEERADASAALAKAARDARAAFGDQAQEQLGDTLKIVAAIAADLGISIGDDVKAMLDAHSISFSGGTIALHDREGVPLRGLGTGSTRLLVAGLQRKAAAQATIILVDELEHGLEPHRIIRLLGSLGAKEAEPPLQVFLTTHSPMALRELSASQLFVVRSKLDKHKIHTVGTADDIQSTIRLYPEAFLARSVIVCEGASEVGLMRGLDQYRTSTGHKSIFAMGVSLVDCGGGGADRCYKRAAAFQALGYRTAIIQDGDEKPSGSIKLGFVMHGGKVLIWPDGHTLEDELFLNLTDAAVIKLIEYAIELHGNGLIDEHIKSASQNAADVESIQTEALVGDISLESREFLGKAASYRKSGWFKSVTWMENAACNIVGPDLTNVFAPLSTKLDEMFTWANQNDG